MNANPRQLKLLDAVRTNGSITVERLSELLGVTLQTVRRDIQRLSDARLLARFHGGVCMPRSTTENIAYLQRQRLNAAGKQRIAEAIAEQTPDDSSLILGIGTTTEAIARALLRHSRLRVITNNLNVAVILSDNPSFEVMVAGGSVRLRDRAIVGEDTVDFFRQFKVDIALIGVSSIEADGKLRDFDPREVKVAQTIIAQSRMVWVAADASKFNRPAMVELASLSQIDRLFTDAPPPDPFPELLRQAEVRCEVVDGQSDIERRSQKHLPAGGTALLTL